MIDDEGQSVIYISSKYVCALHGTYNVLTYKLDHSTHPLGRIHSPSAALDLGLGVQLFRDY